MTFSWRWRMHTISVCTVAILFTFAEHIVANTDAQAEPVAISSHQSPEFVELARNKVLLVVGKEFLPLAVRLFQKESIPNSAVVVVADMPSRLAAIFVNGKRFEFYDTTDNVYISDFEHQKLAAVMVHLREHLKQVAQ